MLEDLFRNVVGAARELRRWGCLSAPKEDVNNLTHISAQGSNFVKYVVLLLCGKPASNPRNTTVELAAIFCCRSTRMVVEAKKVSNPWVVSVRGTVASIATRWKLPSSENLLHLQAAVELVIDLLIAVRDVVSYLFVKLVQLLCCQAFATSNGLKDGRHLTAQIGLHGAATL